MIHSQRSTIIATGLAMFSMFFGAGNIVFPLALGQTSQNQTIFAILGILITAVLMPFAGLLAMSLYDGDYKKFFNRIGVVPGFILAAFIMGLIGPFGAMPRCIALSYSTAATFLPGISLPLFSLIACVVIFLFTFRPNTILDMLGYILTPLLLGSLGIIIVMGLIFAPELGISDNGSWDTFVEGLNSGYQTMDLLGAFFFSSVIVMGLKNDLPPAMTTHRNLITIAFKASLIGAFLLALTYIGFGFVAAHHSAILDDAPKDTLISLLAVHILGPYASIVACIAVALACLTTALALAAVFAEFIHNDIAACKIGYIPALVATLVITFLVSTLNFTGIVAFLAPILQICYPALIVLTILNIFHQLNGLKMVKIPVLLTFLVSLGFYFLT